jgi:endonuclease/exonuclease/phosphatase family metal-dependent hydrolase
MPRVTVGTFNIRLFPDRETAPDAVAERIVELGADVVMVQEIRDPVVFAGVLLAASAATGRRYQVALGPMCESSVLQVGVVFDADKLTVAARREQRELDPLGRCSCRIGHPPALLLVLDTAWGGRLCAMSVHLQFGARRWQYRARREQWEELVASMVRVEAEFGGKIAVAGDFNSTGYLDDDRGERRFIHATCDAAGLVLATRGVGCTAYWQPNRRTRDYMPSALDHILLREPAHGPAEPLGMCAALGGRSVPGHQHNVDFHTVSDHCPVRVVVDV